MIVQIAADVFDEVEATVGSLPAEQCGWLGAAPGEYITHYFFDQVGERGREHITLGPYLLDRLYALWPSTIRIAGFVHSHPYEYYVPFDNSKDQFTVPSSRDIDTLNHFRMRYRLPFLFVPMVLPHADFPQTRLGRLIDPRPWFFPHFLHQGGSVSTVKVQIVPHRNTRRAGIGDVPTRLTDRASSIWTRMAKS
jgi:hypothetical protein